MKEIKLWQITTDINGKPSVDQLKNVKQTETENLLEEIIVHSPDLLLPDLKLVGRQTDTPGGPLDLLGVDGDGNLVVFELKRGTLNREAIAQVIDYTSYLTYLDPEELSKHISERSGKLGIDRIDDFRSWYLEQFAKDITTIHKIRMFLVGLGADDRTRRMANFLSESELDISLITFYGFEKDGNNFLARQLEVEAKPPIVDSATPTKKGNLEKLQKKVQDLQVEDYYYNISNFLRNQLSAYEWPNQSGFSYYLVELTESGAQTNRVYISLYLSDLNPGKVNIYRHPRAIEISKDTFLSVRENLGDQVNIRKDGAIEIWISSNNEWNKIQPYLEKICKAIIEGWKHKREREVVKEFEEAKDNIELEKVN
jgi:hypothetical protein